MKFVSRSANYCVILKHGMAAEPLSGKPALSAVSVKFQNGIATSDNEEICDLLLKHPAYKSDYILVEEEGKDPYSEVRGENEPEHDMIEVKFGTAGKNLNPKGTNKLSAAHAKIITDMAKDMAIKMAPELAKEMLKSLVDKDKKAEPASTVKVEVVDKEESVPQEENVSNEKVTEEQETKFICGICGTSAKSKAGLMAHKRFCEKKQNNITE